jgi:hypothetical protein
VRVRSFAVVFLLVAIVVVTEPTPSADQVQVRFPEGVTHGFLALRSLDGTMLANGDLLQTAKDDQVTTRLVFHFRDGSLQDETSIFTQSGTFKLLSNHLIQKGPSFPESIDQTLDMSTGQVAIKYSDKNGKAKNNSDRMDLPADLSNGVLLSIVKNIRPDELPISVGFLAGGSKPRLVKLVITGGVEETFKVNGAPRKATHYIIKVRIGGVSGLLAPVVGKQPPDSHVWIARGDVPAFVKAEQPFYVGGPLWRIELVTPAFPSH